MLATSSKPWRSRIESAVVERRPEAQYVMMRRSREQVVGSGVEATERLERRAGDRAMLELVAFAHVQRHARPLRAPPDTFGVEHGADRTGSPASLHASTPPASQPPNAS